MVFIEAFLVQRFLITAPSLTTTLPNDDESATLATKIIQSLINDGLVHFMSNVNSFNDNDYNKYESVLFLLIKNIIKKYPKMFANLPSSRNKEYDQTSQFQHDTFNQPDMFSIIVQFLDLYSLINCTIVDSNWLINLFTPKAIGKLDFAFFENDGKSISNNWRRVGKRLCNARHVYFEEGSLSIVNKIVPFCSMMDTLDASISDYQDDESVKFVKSLHNFVSKLKSFVFFAGNSDIDICDASAVASHKTLTSTTPVVLMNCENVDINGGLFPVIITNKCRKLSLVFECLLDYTSKYFDASGVEELKISQLMLINPPNINSNINIISDDIVIDNYNYKDRYINTKAVEYTCVKLANELCKNVKKLLIYQLTYYSLQLWIALHHQRKLIAMHVDEKQRLIKPMIVCLNFVAQIDEVNQIIKNRLLISCVIVSPRFKDEDIEEKEAISAFVALLDYLLNNDKNKLQFLTIVLPLGEGLLQSVINCFLTLYKTDIKQFEKIVNELEAIQMIPSYEYCISPKYPLVKISLIIQLLDVIVQINTIKLSLKKAKANGKQNTACVFNATFRINGDELNDSDLKTLLFKKIQSMITKKIPICIKFCWTNANVVIGDDIWNVTPLDSIQNWYQKPLFDEKYGQGRNMLQITMNGSRSSLQLSNFDCCDNYLSLW